MFRRFAVLSPLLVFVIVASFLPANGAEVRISKCPPAVDSQPAQTQPLVKKFVFTGTEQEFSRLKDGTSDVATDPLPLIGCYAAIGEIFSGSDNDWQIGSISRDALGFYWKNAAGVSWTLALDSSGDFLITGSGNPYKSSGDKFLIRDPEGLSYRVRGAFGLSGDPKTGLDKKAWVGTQGFPLPQSSHSYGFSYYTHVWPLFRETIKDITASAGVTWIYPRMQELSFQERLKLCPVALDGLQSMEGGLAWAKDQFKFPTLLPKYKLNPVADCYSSDAPHTAFWNFVGNQMQEGRITNLLISNQMLVPPDGFTFADESAGGMLGVATMAVPFKPLQSSTQNESGDQSWMVFFNSEKFKGPIALYPAQLWSAFGKTDPIKKKFTFDNGGGYLTGAALEWGGFPFTEFRQKDGTVFSKVPPMQFPSDAQGNTVIMSDFKAYSKEGFYNKFKDYLISGSNLPNTLTSNSAFNIRMQASHVPLFQAGKSIDPFAEGQISVLQGGNAFGFSWKEKSKIVTPGNLFRENSSQRASISLTDAPKELIDYSFMDTVSSKFRYDTPSWWRNTDNSEVKNTLLKDGSEVSYVWIRFIDQPGVKALNLNSTELNTLQKLIVDFQQTWNGKNDFMQMPTQGVLATFDDGLMVKPPVGKEFGYVPIVISQIGKSTSSKDSGLLSSPSSAFQKQLRADLAEAEAKAAAAAKAKAEAEARVKAEAEAKAKIEEEARQKAEAEAKAKAAEEELRKTKAATKKKTIVCVKGSSTKKVTAVKPKCPAGYKIKASK